MQEPHPPVWLTRGRIPGLDGLRGLAILLVLLDHVVRTDGFPGPAALRRVQFIGPVGVDVFFLISGFLITLLLSREMARTQTIALRAFYYRRALRLMPAFVLYAAAVIALSAVGLVAVPPSQWGWVFTYTVNFHPDPAWEISHIWSLSVEEQFYLTWPVVLLFAGPAKGKYILAGCLLLAPCLRLATSMFFPEYLVQANFWTPTRMDAIALGCLLAILAESSAFRRKTRWTGWAALTPAVVVLAALASSAVLSRTVPHFRPALGYSIKVWALGCVFWMVLNNIESRLLRILAWRPLVGLGVLSYSLYLWQQLFVNHTRPEWIHRWPQNVVVAVAAAAASYLLVESRFLKMKDRAASPRDREATQGAILSSVTTTGRCEEPSPGRT